MSEKKLKNESIYNVYAIQGWPCHFYTLDAADKYNAKIEMWCERLKDGARDLSVLQKIKRFFYLGYLDVFDVAIYKISAQKGKNHGK